jgi:hypothetical protein
VTLTNRNYPGRCLIPVCIVPSAKSSTANRLIPFSQQATAAALSRSSINTCTPPPVHTTTISPRFTHYSLHRFRRFRPTFHQTPSSSPQRWPHEPAHLLCGLLPLPRPLSIPLSQVQATVPVVLPTPTAPMPGFRHGRSLQVQDRTRTMSATASSHARSSLQDHATLSRPFIARVRPAPTQHGQSSSMSLYPHRSPLVYPALLSLVTEALQYASHSDVVKDGPTYKNAFDGRQAVD